MWVTHAWRVWWQPLYGSTMSSSSYSDGDDGDVTASSHESYDVYSDRSSESSSEDGTVNLKVAKSFLNLSWIFLNLIWANSGAHIWLMLSLHLHHPSPINLKLPIPLTQASQEESSDELTWPCGLDQEAEEPLGGLGIGSSPPLWFLGSWSATLLFLFFSRLPLFLRRWSFDEGYCQVQGLAMDADVRLLLDSIYSFGRDTLDTWGPLLTAAYLSGK